MGNTILMLRKSLNLLHNPFMKVIHTIGRRKSAVARIYLKEGSGKLTVNRRDYKEYFPSEIYYQKLDIPFEITSNKGSFDVVASVKGGGLTGQSGALGLAISRALLKVNEENRTLLKPEGLLKRDARVVERKKYGRKKARKKFQFSKR